MSFVDILMNISVGCMYVFVYSVLRLADTSMLTEVGLLVRRAIYPVIGVFFVTTLLISIIQRKPVKSYNYNHPAIILVVLVLILLSEFFIIQ